jgi:hypothetical protein
VSEQSRIRIQRVPAVVAKVVAGVVAVIALFGCAPPGTPGMPTPSAGPSSRPSTNASPTAPAAGATPTSPHRPPIGTLRTALQAYFRDDRDLPPDKAQVAADCAVYPAYQELSPQSLNLLVKQDAADLAAGEQKVFGDVVTECVTSAVG